MIRVGVVTYLKARGLGYDAVALRATLAEIGGVSASFFPVFDLYRVDRKMRKAKLRPAPVSGAWAWPEAERRLDLATWVARQDVVVTLEAFLREVASVAFESGVALVHVPNLEWISDREGWWTDLRAADAVVAKTRHTEAALLGAGLQNVVYAPLTPPLPIEPPRPTATPITFFHSAGIGGSHDPKNPRAVLEAFAAVLAGRDDACGIVKSQVPFARRKSPIDLAPYRGIGNLEIVEGETSYDDVLDLTRRADVTVYPSRAEGLGLPLLESLALGVPVVTTDAPPMNELVTDGVNGRLVPGREAGRHRHVPLIEVDGPALAETLVALADIGIVDALKAGTNDGVRTRREAFRTGLESVLERVGRKPGVGGAPAKRP